MAISPSEFLGAIVGTSVLSLPFQITGKEKWENFLGQWIPAALLLGLYSKVGKLERPDISDSSDRGSYSNEFTRLNSYDALDFG